MSLKSFPLKSLFIGLFLFSTAEAAVITQNTTGALPTVLLGFSLGQSVTTPSDGPWNNLTFNWVSTGGNPYAIGSLFLLSQPYTGVTANLSASTIGYIDSTSTIAGGKWAFAASTTIQANTQYYFYMSAAFNGSVEVLYSVLNPYSGGSEWFSALGGPYTDLGLTDLQFQLEGTTPEPGTFLLGIVGLTALVLFRRN